MDLGIGFLEIGVCFVICFLRFVISTLLFLMEATFFGIWIFPPPASGTYIFSFFDGPGAGLATNAGKSFFMQGADGDIVAFDVIPNIWLSPVDERINFL